MANEKNYPLPKELAAEKLLTDPRVAEAKTLLHAAIEDASKQLTGVRPPIPELKQTYETMLKDMGKHRGGGLWFPYLGSGFGKGALVELADGSVKYDFICGIGPNYFGHNNPAILDALVDAAISNTVMQGNLQQNVDSLELVSQLVKASGLAHCFLSTSGAMANENALKLAFQKRTPAYRILAFEHCFAGRSLAVSQITDKPAYREGLPTNVFVDYVPFYNPEYPVESTARTVEALKKYIARYPGGHALMCFEFVQGEGGFYSATREYFIEVMDILKKHNIAIFADEVQTFARTPELFAYQFYGLQSYIDIASTGKISQVCATLFTDEYLPKPGLLSQTFTGSTSAIKSSLTILHELRTGSYFGPEGRNQKLHNYFTEKLESLSKRHPQLIRGPFGVGCMIAFTPYDGESKKVNQFVHRLFDAGVISFVAGSDPTRVRFLIPAGVITLQDIDNAMNILEKTLLKEA